MQATVTRHRDIQPNDRSIAFLIFGFLLAAYLFTYTGVIQSSDGLAMFATTESIARRGAIDANQVLWMDVQQGSYGPDGNLYSRKGLGMPLLALPLVWLAKHWRLAGLVQAALLLNPLLTAWTAGLIFRAGRRLDWTRNTSIAAALIFGLGSMAWPYTQTFFSDPISAWGLFAAAYGLLSYSQSGYKRYLGMGGLAWGLAYLSRTVNLLTLPIYLIGLIIVLQRQTRRGGYRPGLRMAVSYYWRPITSFMIPVVAAGLASLWWNWVRYGSIFATGYASSERFDANWLFGVFGLLLGPARGFFWYSPILLLAIPGAIWFWRNQRQIFWLTLAVSAVYVLTYGKWYMWHGGYSWGPRFLLPLTPFMALFSGPAWAWLMRGKLAGWVGKALAVVLIIISVAVQWLGLLIPFSLVQDWLAQAVTPLFAPEPFVRLQYSPLLLQWRFLTPENIHLAWWRSSLQLGRPDWLGVLMPLSALLVGFVLLWRQPRAPRVASVSGAPGNWIYTGGLLLIMLAILTYYLPFLSSADNRAIAQRIQAMEERDDVILHLQPEQTQQFANAYHGNLPTYGLLPQNELDDSNQAWLTRLSTENRRLWVIPNYTPPEQSGWERALRTDDYLLVDSHPAGQGGDRLALYALEEAYSLTETGLGTVFGDPDSDVPVTEENGWIRLEGYSVTPTVEPGGELLLALVWRSLQPVDYDYHVFVHLLDASGAKLDQRDGQPVQWMRPTSTWQAGEEIVDRYGLLLPADLPVGSYAIVVGLYDPVSGQRLPVSAGPGDYAIEIGPIEAAWPR
jgi:hypothetical protein